MGVFVYAGRRRDGSLVQAEIEAASAADVAAVLREAEVTPVRIAPRGASVSDSAKIQLKLFRERVSLEELILVCRQMHRLARSGIPIVRSIESLAESSERRALARTLREVAVELRSGHELSVALRRHPSVFPPIVTSVIQVGEATGDLDQAWRQLAEYLELERDTRRRIKSAMRYPMLVLVAIVGAMFLINLFVIPSFAKVFEGFGAELPWATQILVETSRLTVAYWPHALAGLIGLVLGARAWVRTPAGRRRWDQRRLRLPLVGSIVRKATVGRYARGLSMALHAGIPVLHALQVVARAVENVFVSERVMEMRESLERGETLTRATAGSGLFSPLFLQMLAVGEETGVLAEIHREIAESCEADVDYALKGLAELIEPLLIVVMGGLVLVLALGVYLPMWDLARVAKGG